MDPKDDNRCSQCACPGFSFFCVTFSCAVCTQAALFRSNPHKNIITSYEPMESAEASYLPLELACSEVPDAFSAVESYGPMSEPSAQVLFGQVVTALRHSYSMGIYHGDVKPENILLCHCGEGGHACGLVKVRTYSRSVCFALMCTDGASRASVGGFRLSSDWFPDVHSAQCHAVVWLP